MSGYLDSAPATQPPAANDVSDALTAALGDGWIDSVTGDSGGPYTVTFSAAKGDVPSLAGSSQSGLSIRVDTNKNVEYDASGLPALT